MQTLDKRGNFIDGEWRAATATGIIHVVNPANEDVFAYVSASSAADVNSAVQAARTAFGGWSGHSLEERVEFLRRICYLYEGRLAEIGAVISQEMGAPITMAVQSQAASGLYHLRTFLEELKSYSFEYPLRPGLTDQKIIHEPIGVCGLITPWNWPMNQLCLKVVPALAAGCTVVVKPSEIAPLSSMLFAELVEEAGLPKGVFNLVNGSGEEAGAALSSHPDVDMISFTGSARAGCEIARAAASGVKRVSLELGGKSPFLLFADADVQEAVRRCVNMCFDNSGQSCNAPARLLVQRPVYEQVVQIAATAAMSTTVGDPSLKGEHLGPVSSAAQYTRVRNMIQAGLDEGARLVAGGLGNPVGFQSGYYVKPTIFADVDNDMTIAQEEIFGPVLVIIPFGTVEDAVRIANDSPYGLAAYVETGDLELAQRVARTLRVGMVQINGASKAAGSPFGGYKKSGNGREGGRWGIEDFLEVKLISG